MAGLRGSSLQLTTSQLLDNGISVEHLTSCELRIFTVNCVIVLKGGVG
jgi:hypothetical protein